MQAPDRVGLLSSISAAFAELSLDVVEASIATPSASGDKGAVARDSFTVTARGGGPVRDARTLRQLHGAISAHIERASHDAWHLSTLTRSADIVLVAVGFPHLVRCEGAALNLICLHSIALDHFKIAGVENGTLCKPRPAQNSRRKDRTEADAVLHASAEPQLSNHVHHCALP